MISKEEAFDLIKEEQCYVCEENDYEVCTDDECPYRVALDTLSESIEEE